ncbi:MAG TPA: prolyl oligopeptidase family serine peptidase [Thermoanaerobaculia bacterium]|nr:prolyl oligopeptidase family serine peptidase [Thermoanaerobaculia bacterium]
MRRSLLALALFTATALLAAPPANLVVENVPDFPPDLVEKVRPYLDFRTANLEDWNPVRAEALISTRFGEATQLHIVKMPGGARKQITFFRDRVAGGGFRPHDGNTIIVQKDIGGNEFFQIYRLDVPTGDLTLITDGKSRNLASAWSRDGKWLAYSSAKRNGNDTDIWIVDPSNRQSARMAMQVEGGGWEATDFSRDNSKILVTNGISANETQLYLVDVATGTKTLLTPKRDVPVAYSSARFSADDGDLYFTSDEGSEFQQLVRMHLADGSKQVITHEKWDVDFFTLDESRKRVAYVTNENGAGVLHVIDISGRELLRPKLPYAVVRDLRWHPNGHLLGFSMQSAKSPTDVYALNVDTGAVERWTESETGGLNPERNADPQLVTMKSFDGTQISAFVYRPEPMKFPGKRPSILIIHGGPEGQTQPNFLGRSNYWINELGIALVYPNVRGSTGYGKTYLAMDNGFKREDTVKDIGTVINWIKSDPALDPDRIAVYGGSYGGYMTLATMTHYNSDLRAAVDVVGISNFLTFLQNTSGYRRDLRRVEYGDERDPKMHDFLQQISPLTSASKITRPLFVIAGFNDPRVPWTEGQQIVQTVRASGAPVWWLMAKDEGHGFAKRSNQDYQFLAMTEFWEQYLLH